jgi:O-antigen/teichoic acid export membrane protein
MHRFTQVAVTNALQGVLKIVIALVFFVTATTNPALLLLVYAAAPAVPFIWLGFTFPRWLKLRIGNLSHPERKVFGQLAIHAGIAFVIAGIVENIDILFVQRYLDSYEVGLLAGISRIALLFSVLAYALSTVLNSRVARYASWVDQQAFLKKAWFLLGLTVLSWLALIPVAQLLIQFTIGPAYLAGSQYLVLLLAASMLTIAVVPFTALFYSINKPWFFSLTAVVQLVIILVGNIGFVSEFGLGAAVWTRLIARLVLLGLTLFLISLYFQKPRSASLGEKF